jgi:hypothetical protein
MHKQKRKRIILSPKELKERELLYTIGRFNFWFEEAVTPRIANITEGIKDIKVKIQEIKQKIDEHKENNIEFDENGRPSESYLEFFSELGSLDCEMDFLSEQRLSIEEMKLVCLYKDFEILMKEIIELSFPDVGVKDVFKWDNVKNLLKGYGILVGDIKNLNLINDLRIVSNNIKHSNIIGDTVKKAKIVEFEYNDKFDCESLSDFYDRIRDEPIKFLDYLAKKIIEHLFVFDDDRLDEIVSRFESRMEKETVKKLAEALIRKCT